MDTRHHTATRSNPDAELIDFLAQKPDYHSRFSWRLQEEFIAVMNGHPAKVDLEIIKQAAAKADIMAAALFLVHTLKQPNLTVKELEQIRNALNPILSFLQNYSATSHTTQRINDALVDAESLCKAKSTEHKTESDLCFIIPRQRDEYSDIDEPMSREAFLYLEVGRGQKYLVELLKKPLLDTEIKIKITRFLSLSPLKVFDIEQIKKRISTANSLVAEIKEQERKALVQKCEKLAEALRQLKDSTSPTMTDDAELTNDNAIPGNDFIPDKQSGINNIVGNPEGFMRYLATLDNEKLKLFTTSLEAKVDFLARNCSVSTLNNINEMWNKPGARGVSGNDDALLRNIDSLKAKLPATLVAVRSKQLIKNAVSISDIKHCSTGEITGVLEIAKQIETEMAANVKAAEIEEQQKKHSQRDSLVKAKKDYVEALYRIIETLNGIHNYYQSQIPLHTSGSTLDKKGCEYAAKASTYTKLIAQCQKCKDKGETLSDNSSENELNSFIKEAKQTLNEVSLILSKKYSEQRRLLVLLDQKLQEKRNQINALESALNFKSESARTVENRIENNSGVASPDSGSTLGQIESACEETQKQLDIADKHTKCLEKIVGAKKKLVKELMSLTAAYVRCTAECGKVEADSYVDKVTMFLTPDLSCLSIDGINKLLKNPEQIDLLAMNIRNSIQNLNAATENSKKTSFLRELEEQKAELLERNKEFMAFALVHENITEMYQETPYLDTAQECLEFVDEIEDIIKAYKNNNSSNKVKQKNNKSQELIDEIKNFKVKSLDILYKDALDIEVKRLENYKEILKQHVQKLKDLEGLAVKLDLADKDMFAETLATAEVALSQLELKGIPATITECQRLIESYITTIKATETKNKDLLQVLMKQAYEKATASHSDIQALARQLDTVNNPGEDPFISEQKVAEKSFQENLRLTYQHGKKSKQYDTYTKMVQANSLEFRKRLESMESHYSDMQKSAKKTQEKLTQALTNKKHTALCNEFQTLLTHLSIAFDEYQNRDSAASSNEIRKHEKEAEELIKTLTEYLTHDLKNLSPQGLEKLTSSEGNPKQKLVSNIESAIKKFDETVNAIDAAKKYASEQQALEKNLNLLTAALAKLQDVYTNFNNEYNSNPLKDEACYIQYKNEAFVALFEAKKLVGDVSPQETIQYNQANLLAHVIGNNRQAEQVRNITKKINVLRRSISVKQQAMAEALLDRDKMASETLDTMDDLSSIEEQLLQATVIEHTTPATVEDLRRRITLWRSMPNATLMEKEEKVRAGQAIQTQMSGVENAAISKAELVKNITRQLQSKEVSSLQGLLARAEQLGVNTANDPIKNKIDKFIEVSQSANLPRDTTTIQSVTEELDTVLKTSPQEVERYQKLIEQAVTTKLHYLAQFEILYKDTSDQNSLEAIKDLKRKLGLSEHEPLSASSVTAFISKLNSADINGFCKEIDLLLHNAVIALENLQMIKINEQKQAEENEKQNINGELEQALTHLNNIVRLANMLGITSEFDWSTHVAALATENHAEWVQGANRYKRDVEHEISKLKKSLGSVPNFVFQQINGVNSAVAKLYQVTNRNTQPDAEVKASPKVHALRELLGLPLIPDSQDLTEITQAELTHLQTKPVDELIQILQELPEAISAAADELSQQQAKQEAAIQERNARTKSKVCTQIHGIKINLLNQIEDLQSHASPTARKEIDDFTTDYIRNLDVDLGGSVQQDEHVQRFACELHSRFMTPLIEQLAEAKRMLAQLIDNIKSRQNLVTDEDDKVSLQKRIDKLTNILNSDHVSLEQIENAKTLAHKTVEVLAQIQIKNKIESAIKEAQDKIGDDIQARTAENGGEQECIQVIQEFKTGILREIQKIGNGYRYNPAISADQQFNDIEKLISAVITRIDDAVSKKCAELASKTSNQYKADTGSSATQTQGNTTFASLTLAIQAAEQRTASTPSADTGHLSSTISSPEGVESSPTPTPPVTIQKNPNVITPSVEEQNQDATKSSESTTIQTHRSDSFFVQKNKNSMEPLTTSSEKLSNTEPATKNKTKTKTKKISEANSPQKPTSTAIIFTTTNIERVAEVATNKVNERDDLTPRFWYQEKFISPLQRELQNHNNRNSLCYPAFTHLSRSLDKAISEKATSKSIYEWLEKSLNTCIETLPTELTAKEETNFKRRSSLRTILNFITCGLVAKISDDEKEFNAKRKAQKDQLLQASQLITTWKCQLASLRREGDLREAFQTMGGALTSKSKPTLVAQQAATITSNHKPHMAKHQPSQSWRDITTNAATSPVLESRINQVRRQKDKITQLQTLICIHNANQKVSASIISNDVIKELVRLEKDLTKLEGNIRKMMSPDFDKIVFELEKSFNAISQCVQQYSPSFTTAATLGQSSSKRPS